MRLQIEPLPGETARLCNAVATATVPRWPMNLTFFALTFSVSVAAFVFAAETAFATFAIGVGGVLASLFAIQALSRQQIRRQANDPHALETYFVELSPESFRTWCDHIDVRLSWSEFSRVTENNEFYLFARRNGGGTGIPKRVLDEASDLALRQSIIQWAPDRGTGLARPRGSAAPAV